MNLLKYISIIILTVVLQFPTSAQDWVSHQSQNQINDLVDNGNELLMATDVGLVSLNKLTFEKTILTTSNSNLSSNHIQSITQNASGDTWIGTYDMRLAQFDGTDFQDEVIPDGIDNPITIELYDIEFAPNGDLWVGTSEGVFHQQGQNWTKYAEAELGQDFFAVWDIEINAAGEVFMGALDVIKFANGAWSNITENSNMTSYLHAELFFGSTGDLFFLGDLDKLGRFDGTTWQEYDNGGLNGSQAINFTEDTDGNIYYSTNNNGVFKLEDDSWVSQTGLETEALNDRVTYFYIDDQNVKWLNNGIFLAMDNNGNIQNNLISANTIEGNGVDILEKGGNGKMYFFTSRDHYISVEDLDGNWSFLTPPSDLASVNFVNDMLVLNDNDIYIATSERLYHYDGTEWTSEEIGGSSLATDSQGRIYMRSTGKIYIIDNGMTSEYNTSNSPLSSFILSGMGVGANDNLWIASFTWEGDNAIQKVTAAGDWTTYSGVDHPAIDEPRGDFHFDGNGNVWVPVGGVGAIRFDGTTWFNPYTGNLDQMINYKAQSIQSDAAGKLYFSHQYGVTTLLDGEWEDLIIEDVPNVNSSQRTNIKFDDDGTLWWASNVQGVFSRSADMTISIADIEAANNFELYPNPASDYTILDFTIEENAHVNVLVHNYLGQLQIRLDLGQLQAGTFQERIDLTHFAKGFYTIQLEINHQFSTKKMVVR